MTSVEGQPKRHYYPIYPGFEWPSKSQYRIDIDHSNRKATFNREDIEFMVEFSIFFNKEIASEEYPDLIMAETAEDCRKSKESVANWVIVLSGLTEKTFYTFKDRFDTIKSNRENKELKHEIVSEIIKHIQL